MACCEVDYTNKKIKNTFLPPQLRRKKLKYLLEIDLSKQKMIASY